MSSLILSNSQALKTHFPKGFTLIEVLVTLIITTIALLGFVGLQNRVQSAELEASRRVQATLIASYMIEQIKANPELGTNCLFPASLKVGTSSGNGNYVCAGDLAGQQSVRLWHQQLVGSGEKIGVDNVGGVTNGRGCINYTAPVVAVAPASGTPSKYTVSVAWQGFVKTAAGGLSGSCGFGDYGDSGYHRLVAYEVYAPEVNMSSEPEPENCDNEVGEASEYTDLSSPHHWVPSEQIAGGPPYVLNGNYEFDHLCLDNATLTVNGKVKVDNFHCGGGKTESGTLNYRGVLYGTHNHSPLPPASVTAIDSCLSN